MRLAGILGEARPAIEDADALVSLVGVAGLSHLAAPLRAAGLETLLIGDAHLPRDMAGAMLTAARPIE